LLDVTRGLQVMLDAIEFPLCFGFTKSGLHVLANFAGNTSGQGHAIPDLIAINGDSVNGYYLEFDPDKSWDEKKEVYRLSNQIVRTQNVTQTAIGDKKGWWTTVVAAAVLVIARR